MKLFFLNGRAMFQADRDHIHHRLLQLGFNQKKAVILLYSVSLLLGGLAFAAVYFKNLNNALLVGTIGVASYIALRKLEYQEIQFLRNGILLPLFDRPAIHGRILQVFTDMAFIVLAYYLAYLLRFEGSFDREVNGYYLLTVPLVLSAKMMVFFLSGLYRKTWKHAGIGDLVKIFKAVSLGCAASALLLWAIPSFRVLSPAALFIDFHLLLFFIVGGRSSFRVLEYLHLNDNPKGLKVLIYGVDSNSLHALKEMTYNPRLNFRPVGFIEDEPRYQGKQVNGLPVYGPLDQLGGFLEREQVSGVIVAEEKVPQEKLDLLTQICNARRLSLHRFHTRLETISAHWQEAEKPASIVPSSEAGVWKALKEDQKRNVTPSAGPLKRMSWISLSSFWS